MGGRGRIRSILSFSLFPADNINTTASQREKPRKMDGVEVQRSLSTSGCRWALLRLAADEEQFNSETQQTGKGMLDNRRRNIQRCFIDSILPYPSHSRMSLLMRLDLLHPRNLKLSCNPRVHAHPGPKILPPSQSISHLCRIPIK